MSAKTILHQAMLNEWVARIAEQKASGLNVSEWCIQNRNQLAVSTAPNSSFDTTMFFFFKIPIFAIHNDQILICCKSIGIIFNNYNRYRNLFI